MAEPRCVVVCIKLCYACDYLYTGAVWDDRGYSVEVIEFRSGSKGRGHEWFVYKRFISAPKDGKVGLQAPDDKLQTTTTEPMLRILGRHRL